MAAVRAAMDAVMVREQQRLNSKLILLTIAISGGPYIVKSFDANGGAGSYIATANDGGPGVYAFGRGSMLVGAAATFQRKTIPGLPGFGFESPTPADLDMANPPPPNAPAVIMRHRDTENHNGPAVTGSTRLRPTPRAPTRVPSWTKAISSTTSSCSTSTGRRSLWAVCSRRDRWCCSSTPRR